LPGVEEQATTGRLEHVRFVDDETFVARPGGV
jgi:hypothetical protein